jgi:hypothetical protein
MSVGAQHLLSTDAVSHQLHYRGRLDAALLGNFVHGAVHGRMREFALMSGHCISQHNR